MKKGKGIYFFALFFLVFTGCENPLNNKNNESPIPAEKGSFSLMLSSISRTILPDTPDLNDFAVYNLAFTPESGGTALNTDRTNATLSTETILLEPGTYNLIVNAYKDNGKTQLIAHGTLDGIVITAGQNTAKTVTLEAILAGGTGTFTWNITLPTGVTTASMTITTANAGGTSQQTVTLLPNNCTENRPLNSGPYNLTFNFGKDDGKSVVWKELLYVYQNLESVFDFEFTDAHLSDSVYTVTFNSNGGEPGEWEQSVLHGAQISMPVAPTKDWYLFSGWYTDNDTFAKPWASSNPVIESFTLYVKWDVIPLASTTGLANKLAWLQIHAQSNGCYILDVNADESIAPHTLSYNDRNNIVITLIGVDSNQTISLSSTGVMVTVEAGVTLILDDNITLQGHNNNSDSIVRVNSGGALVMKERSTISGNATSSYLTSYGGAVYVSGGFFIMEGGEISSNTGDYGVVYVSEYGNFSMTGGEIYDNIINSSGRGGVVYVSDGTFSMTDGKIFNNLINGFSGNSAVYVGEGTFTMEGGEISGNTSSSYYHYYCVGVFVDGTFAMEDGKIFGNSGGGVYVSECGNFIMQGGEISNNTGDYGGVQIPAYGTFIMKGGEISNNTSSGVYVSDNGIFYMTGGEISNNIGRGVEVGYEGTFTMNGGNIFGNFCGVESIGTFIMEYGEISGNISYGGVYLNGGTFKMSDGVISGNTAFYSGGGVYVSVYATFTMTDGEISGNTTSSSSDGNDGSGGGGVYVSGTFTMSGGTISGNTIHYPNKGGGGVYVYGGTFTMSGGVISGNTASYDDSYGYDGSGGGVYVWGIFTMSGGVISGNTATRFGGGVYVVNMGGTFFTKIGGTIYGYSVNDIINSNVVRDNSGMIINGNGHAVFADGKIKETTAGPEVDLDSSKYGVVGGWDY